ncbi:MAG: hypothetical protein AAFR51_12070, partial [Pseudomonadota bacterium]
MTKYLTDSAPQTRLETESRLRNKLMVAASAGILALAAPGGLYGMRAEAQALPAGCEDANLNNPGDPDEDNDVFDDDETVTCVQDVTTVGDIDPINSTASNATLIIGDGVTQTRVFNPGGPAYGPIMSQNTSIKMSGTNDQRLEITENATIVNAGYLEHSVVSLTSSNGTIDIESRGSVVSRNAQNTSNESRDVAIDVGIDGGSGNLYIDTQSGFTFGTVEASSAASGLIDIKSGTLRSGNSKRALDVRAGAAVTSVTVATYGLTDGRTEAIYVDNKGTGNTVVTLNDDTLNHSTNYDAVKIQHAAAGDVIFKTLGDVTAVSDDGVRITNSGLGNSTVEIDGNITANLVGLALTHDSLAAATVTLGKDATIDSSNGNGLALESTSTGVGSTLSGDVDLNSGLRSSAVIGAQTGINQITNGGDILIENLASVESGTQAGIYARSSGGEITIRNIDSVTSENGWAIDAETRNSDGNGGFSGGGADISIQNVAILEFDDDNQANTPNIRSANGIRAFSGTGSIDIGADTMVTDSAIGDIYTTGTGIYARSDGGAVDILTAGTIAAGQGGIQVENFGTSTTSIETGGNVTAAAMAGFQVNTGANTTGATITVNYSVTGATNGLSLTHAGSGAATVQLGPAGELIGATGDGALVSVLDAGASAEVSGTLGGASRIEGERYGVNLSTAGGSATVRNLAEVRGGGAQAGLGVASNGGAITIENIDSVASEAGFAISADSAGGEVSIQNVAVGLFDDDNNAATAALRSYHGIGAISGTGNINIGAGSNGASDEIGDLITTSNALFATSTGGNIDVTLAGMVESLNSNAIDLDLDLGGDATLVARGDITAGRVGIEIVNLGSDGTLGTNTVILEGRVYGGTQGVLISHQVTGDTMLQLGAAAEVVGVKDGAILFNDDDASAIQVAGTVGGASRIQGGRNGLRLFQSGGAATVQNLVEVWGGTEDGIYALTGGGALTIENIGSVASQSQWAIDVGTGAGPGEISIQNVAVGLLDHDHNAGTSDIRSANGIRVLGGTGSINIGAGAQSNSQIGDVLTTGTGIYATSTGGPISVNTAGTIDSTAGYGIDLNLSSSGTVNLVTTGTVDAALNGIDIANGAGGNATTTVNVFEDLASEANGLVIAHDAVGEVMLYVGNAAGITGRSGAGVQIATSADQGGAISISGQQGIITGSSFGLDLETVNSSVTVQDLSSIAGGTQDGLSVTTHGGAITIENVDQVTSQSGWAIDAETRNADGNGGFSGGGADISIQNVGVPESGGVYSANGIRAFSGIGNINIGAGSNGASDEIRDVYADGTGIRAETDGGTIDITVAGNIFSTNGRGVFATGGSTAGAIVIDAQGTIFSNNAGVFVEQGSTARVSITTGDDVTSIDNGIDASRSLAGDITVLNAGDIVAEIDGIQLSLEAGGAASVTTNGDIAAGGNGIDISNYSGASATGTTSIFIDANVRGAVFGNYVAHNAVGDVLLQLGADARLTGDTRAGAKIVNAYANSAITVTGGEEIVGLTYGLSLATLASGVIVQDVSKIAGGTQDGLSVTTYGGAITIENIGSVTSESGWAIDAETRDLGPYYGFVGGGADIWIQNVGVPESGGVYSANGIRAYSGIGNINIGADTAQSGNEINNIYAAGTGIRAETDGGTIDIAVAGTITTTTGDGIFAYGGGSAAGIDVNVQGNIATGKNGIYVRQNSADEVSVTTGGQITSTRTGIYVARAVAGTSTIVTGDIINAGTTGIRLESEGGAASITANGHIYSSRYGIYASAQAGTMDIAVTGNIDSASYQSIAVFGGNSAGAVTIDAQGDLAAELSGVNLVQFGIGDVTVTTSGQITSNREHGVFVYRAQQGRSTLVSDDSIIADIVGLYAYNGRGGPVSVTANEAITAGDAGIRVISSTQSPELGSTTVAANARVQGGKQGLDIRHAGLGNVSVSLGTNGELIGLSEAGLDIATDNLTNYAINIGGQTGGSGRIQGVTYGLIATADGAPITIQNIDAIIGGTQDGIALNTGGDITIENIGSVVSEGGLAIYAYTASGSGDVSIQNVEIGLFDHDSNAATADIRSATGIRTITDNGNINIGAAENFDGSEINTIYADGDGIYAFSYSGAIDIAVAGNITSTNNRGIKTYTGYYGGGTSIAVEGDIEAAGYALFVSQLSDGNLSVTTDGQITSASRGIVADRVRAGETTIMANGAIAAGGDGIQINAPGIDGGFGNTSVTANARIQGGGTGLNLQHGGAGYVSVSLGKAGELIGQSDAGLNIQTSNLSNYAIDVLGQSGGAARIEGATYGLVASAAGAPITVQNIDAIMGGTQDGIALNTGGDITIENVGFVVSAGDWAIDANNASGSGDVSIQNVAIPLLDEDNDINSPDIRSANGIRVLGGTGSIDIGAGPNGASDEIGRIYTSGTGIFASSGTGDITINAAGPIDALGGIGIRADSGGGDIEINAAGSVRTNNIGIAVESLGVNDASINLQVEDVTAQGGYNAIFGITDSTEVMTLWIEGNVQAYGSASSVAVSTASGAEITVANGGSVAHGVAASNAIEFTGRNSAETDDTLTLEGFVAADVLMGSGDDRFNYSGAIGAGAVVYGGDGTDTLTVTSTVAKTLTNTGGDMDAIREFEILTLAGDNLTLAGSHTGWSEANFTTGTTFLDGQLSAVMAMISADATLHARDNAVLTGNLTNNGALNIGSSPGTFSLIGDFLQTANG